MRILIISTFFPPQNSIASLRPYSWAKYWTIWGHDVTVLTTEKSKNPSTDLNFENPGYKTIEVPLPSFARKLKQKNQSSSGKGSFIQTIRKKRGIFHSCRMPDLSDLWIRPALQAIPKEQTWDLIVSTCGPYSVHIVAHTLKKRGQNPKWIADYRDYWSNHHIFKGLFPFTLIERFLERWLMKKADAIVTIGDAYAEPFRKKYGSSKVHVIENGFDPNDLNSLPAETIFPQDGKIRLVHTGSFYKAVQDPAPFFKAVAKLGNELDQLEILFVGPELSDLKTLIDQHQVSKWVKVGGFIDRPTALRMQRDAQGLLFFSYDNASVSGVYSGKLFEYLFSNKPIFYFGSKTHPSAQLIEKTNSGQIAHTQIECEGLLRELLKGQLSIRRDRALINSYTRETLSRKLLSIGSSL